MPFDDRALLAARDDLQNARRLERAVVLGDDVDRAEGAVHAVEHFGVGGEARRGAPQFGRQGIDGDAHDRPPVLDGPLRAVSR